MAYNVWRTVKARAAQIATPVMVPA
jgi:hypothetical protein